MTPLFRINVRCVRSAGCSGVSAVYLESTNARRVPVAYISFLGYVYTIGHLAVVGRSPGERFLLSRYGWRLCGLIICCTEWSPRL